MAADVSADLLRHAINLARTAHEYRWSARPPPNVIAEFDDPFLALRCWSEIQRKHQSGALAIAAATSSTAPVEPSTKRLSLRRHKEPAIDPALATMLNTIESERASAELIARGAMEAHDALRAVCPLFVKELCRLANIGDPSTQREAIEAMAPFVLLHNTVAQHPRLQCLSIADGTMVLEIGISVVRTHILTNTYCAASTLVDGERRCAEVRRYASTWLTENCKDNARSIIPVYWRYDVRKNERLTDVEEKDLVNRLMSDVPFLMIGLLELLRLEDSKNAMVRSLFRRLI